MVILELDRVKMERTKIISILVPLLLKESVKNLYHLMSTEVQELEHWTCFYQVRLQVATKDRLFFRSVEILWHDRRVKNVFRDKFVFLRIRVVF